MAADAGWASFCFSVASGPARLHSTFGVTRMSTKYKVAIAIAIASIIAAAILLPAFVPPSVRKMNTCPNNLRMLDGAKWQWALENRCTNGANVTWDEIRPYLKTPPVCSKGGTYILGRVGELPRCSTGGEHTLPPDYNK